MMKLVTKGFLKAQDVQEKVVRVLKNEDGQTGGEYGMILVLVLAVAVPLIVAFRNQISNVIQTVTNQVSQR